MNGRRSLLLLLPLLAGLTSGCDGAGRSAMPVQSEKFLEQTVVTARPSPAPKDSCWHQDLQPAVVETVTEHSLARAAKLGPDGKQLAPAVYASQQKQRIIAERRVIWFQTPCPKLFEPEFIATLQRALKARGLYLQPINGQIDAATQSAIRAYQAPRGLNSGVLSSVAAQSLGLIAQDRQNKPG